MKSVLEFIRETREALLPYHQQVEQHPFLAALEKGQVERDALRAFAGSQQNIITSDLRSVALLLSRHGHLESRQILSDILAGEVSALHSLQHFAAEIAMTKRDLDEFETIPAAHAYCAYVAQIALYGSDADLIGAFTINYTSWGGACGRMSKALKEQYQLSDRAVSFFDLFAGIPPMDTEAEKVIKASLERGVTFQQIKQSARMLQGYEVLFWDAMAEAAGIEST